MKKIITFVRKHKWYIVLFLLFLEIAILTPISGDDWGNFLEGSKVFQVFLLFLGGKSNK